jgi:hypothetical protein
VKKALKISGIVLGVLLLAMLILPFAFKGKIGGIIQTQANKNLNARFTFDGLNINLFSNFPNITASLNDLTIVGVDSFATDTLVYAKSVRMAVNLKSLITDNGFKVKRVELKDARIYIKTLPTGEANYDIMKSDTTPEVEEEDTTAMHFEIEKVELTNVRVDYDDRKHDILAVCDRWNGDLNGDLSSDITTITTNSVIESLSYTQFGFPLLSNVRFETDLTFEADLNNYLFTFKSNKIRLNDMELGFGGSIGLPDDNIAFDLKANTEKVTFKQLLSLVPAFYTKDFKDMKTNGNLQLDFFMKGLMTDTDWPAFGLKLLVENAMFQYPSLPKSVQDIQVALHVSSPGGTLDKALVDLSKFHFSMGGNPFDLTAQVATPMSDADFKGTLAGKLNLGMVKEVYPLPEGTKLQGNIDANVSASGRMSYVDKKQYDKFNLKGALSVFGIQLHSEGMPDVQVKTAKLGFTSQKVNLSALSLLIGKNDLQATGTLSNMLGWFLHDDVLAGTLNVQSTYLNLNDFMTGESTAETDTTPMLAFEIPKNLNLNLNATGKKILFSNLTLTDAKAMLVVKDGRVTIKNLLANALGGSIGATGYYEALNPEKPKVAFGLDLKGVSYAKTFTSFDFVKKIAPIFESIQGNYSMKMDLQTELDKHLNPNLNLLTGLGKLQSSNVKISNVKVLDVLATTLKKENLRNPTIKDLSTTFSIKDGKVTTTPFNIQVGDIGMKLGGITGLDKTIKYDMEVTLPSDMALAGITNLKGTITGKFGKPVIRFNTSAVAKKAATSLADKALTKTLGTNTEETKAKIQQELDKKAELIRAQAKAAGDQLIAGAVKQGDQLIAKASNPIVKAAAKATAAKLKTEAEKKAAAMMTEAEAKIKQMAAEAQASAK